MKNLHAFLVAVLVGLTSFTVSAQALPGKAVKKVSPENLKSLVVSEKTPFGDFTEAALKTVMAPSVKSLSNKAPRKVTPLITTAPEGTVKYYNRAGGSYYRSKTVDSQSGSMITIVFCANNDVYILNPLSGALTNTYVKGTLEGNKIIVPLPQTIYNFSGYNLELAWLDISAYLDGTASSYYDAAIIADRSNTEAVFTIEDGVISLQGSSSSYVLAGVYDDDEMWYGAADFESVYTEATLEETITPPTGIAPVTYYYSGTSYYSNADHNFSSTVQVVKDGNDVYIRGLATGDASYEILPDAWAKGTLSGNKLTIPQGQYMGLYSGNAIYLLGYQNSAAGDITFTYDADEETFTLDNILVVNGKSDAIYYYTYTKAGAVISLTEPEPEPGLELVEVPSTATIENDWTIEASGNKSLNQATSVAFDGNDVYIQGIPYYFKDSWIKGTISNGVASFPSGQFVGADSYGNEFICSIDGSDIQFSYDAENKIFTLTSAYILETDEALYNSNSTNVWCYYTSMKVYKGEAEKPEVVEVPEGLQTEDYVWTGNNLEFDDDENPVTTPFTNFIKVGFDGNDVYVQGLCADLPDAWVKGTINGTTATFATGQYFGVDDRLAYYGYTYPHYFMGYGENGVQDVVFTFNPEAKSFVSEDYIIDNEYKDEMNYYLIYTDNAWNAFTESAGKPAAPSVTGWKLEETSYPVVHFDIPLEDVSGNPMNPNKVFYRVFIDIEREVQQLSFTPEDYENLSETLLEIPYNFDDDWDIYKGGASVYLNQNLDFAAINQIGVQVVYYGGMSLPSGAIRRAPVADNESEIVWAEVKPYTIVGVTDAIATSQVKSVRYYNAAGISSDKPFDGINIVVKRMSDGSTVVEKVRK